MNVDLPDSLIEDAQNGRPIQVLGRRYVLDDGELERLRRTVAAYRELHREAWRPVETTWAEVKAGQVTVDSRRVAWMVGEPCIDGRVRLEGKVTYDGLMVDPAATVRVLAPIPADLTDLLLASELGAACARVDGEA